MKKSLIAPLAGAVAVALLSACSPSSSTAALAGGETITETQVDALVEACEVAGQPLVDGRNTRADVVFFHALGKLAAAGALGEGMGPSAEEAREIAAVQLPPSVMNDSLCGEFFAENIQLSGALEAVQSDVGDEGFVEVLNGLVGQVKLNPKYGRIKVQDNGQLQRDSGSMSTAVDMPVG